MSNRMKKFARGAALAVGTAAVFAVLTGAAGQDAGKWTIKDSLLATRPTQSGFSGTSVSPDGRHLAFAFYREGKYVVFVDGKEVEPGLPYVSQLFYDPSGTRLAYDIRRDGRIREVIGSFQPDGVWKTLDLGPEFDSIVSLVFSPDGKRTAIQGWREGKCLLWVDAAESIPYEGIWYPKFSADGVRLAYAAKSGGRYRMVIDGREGPEYDEITDHYFSADGKHHAVLARRGYKKLVVLDGKEGREYDSIFPLRISADGQQAAYGVGEGGAEFLVVDGEGGREHRDIRSREISFTGAGPSRHFAYSAIKDGKKTAYIDGQPGPAYNDIFGLSFSPDGRRLAYIAESPKPRLVLAESQPDGRWVHKESRELPGQIGKMPVFSPDGKHVACAMTFPDALVVDGEPVTDLKYDFNIYGSLVFDRPDRLNVIILSGQDFRLIEITLK